MPISLETFEPLLPEGIVIAGGVAVILGGAFFGPRRRWTALALGSLLLAAWSFLQSVACPMEASVAKPLLESGPLFFDHPATYFRGLALLFGGLLVLALAGQTTLRVGTEQLGLLLFAVGGLMLAAGASDFILLFIGLELVTFPTYVLLFLGNRGRPSREGAVKYFFLSIFASALFLFGVAHLYGATGSLSLLPSLEASLAQESVLKPSLEKLAVGFILAGLAFKLAAAPFHFYAPDVYEDASNGVAGLLAVMPKIIGILVFLRILGVVVALPGMADWAWRGVVILAILSMTYGNVCALWQKNIRRLMAYSSIAHAGYMLIGVAVALAAYGSEESQVVSGMGATLFYLAVYSAATLGLFAILTHLGSKSQEVDAVDQLRGLGRTHPLSSLILIITLFSLAGIPPLAGFWGKFGLFASSLKMLGEGEIVLASAASQWFLVLAIVAAINAAIAAAYYLRIIGAICFYPPKASIQAEGGNLSLLSGALCAALVIGSGFLPGPLYDLSQKTGEAAMQSPAESPQPVDLIGRNE